MHRSSWEDAIATLPATRSAGRGSALRAVWVVPALVVAAIGGGAMFLGEPDGAQERPSARQAPAPAMEILAPDDAAARP